MTFSLARMSRIRSKSSFQYKVIKVSSNLDENLNAHARKNLEISKFHYYTSLHFRSMIAADIVYKEEKDILASFDEINKLIVSVKQGNRTGLSKAQLHDAKDALKELKNAFIDRRKNLNKQTGYFRDKIGKECGARGEEWYADRMSGRT